MIGKTGRSVLLALVLSFASAGPAFAEPKAEPLRVGFKSGSPSAVLKGHLWGDVQYEYAVAAKPGQWVMVEVVSKPADAAAFVVTDPSGEEISPHYRWSSKVKQAGDFVIRVCRLAEYGASDFTLKVTRGARPVGLSQAKNDKESIALHAAMRKFIEALRKKDRTLFLSCFSRSAPSYHLNPINVGSRKFYRIAVTYSELAADVRARKDLYWTYLERAENGAMDSFVDHAPDGRMWNRVAPGKFVPPDHDGGSFTFVQWRKEGSRWVIDEISYPQA